MGKQNAKHQIIRENFARLKYLCLIFVGYSAFTLVTDFAPIQVWNPEVIGIYRVMDIFFAVFSLAVAIFCWTYKGGNDSVKHFAAAGVLFVAQAWGALITSVEFTAIGYTALSLMMLVAVLFFRFDLAVSVTFFAGIIVAFVGGMLAFGRPNDATVPMLFMLVPLTVVGLLLARRNYKGRLGELGVAARLEELNEELAAAKEHLEDEVAKRTAELVAAKDKAEQGDRLKSAFLANISHEIRTPMNGILGFAELLKDPELSGAEQNEYIANIERSSERMLNTINDIVDIAKIESGDVRLDVGEVDVEKLLRRARLLFLPAARDKGLDLRLGGEPGGALGAVITDADKVFSCLSHLVKNAIKFTVKGGVELGCRLEDSRGSPAGESGGPPVLLFYVKDTGIGVPEDRKAAIFDRFVQADIADSRAFQGAGLGLSIAKAYVAMLGGKIRVESEAGKGSCFSFTVPWKPARNLAGMGLKILVVDDDDKTVLFLCTALREITSNILCASHGGAAVEACRVNPDLDVVLMDIKMPVMSGYEATRLIRQFNARAVIIAQTAFALAGDREKAIECGADDYLTKPLSKAKLFGCIADNLSKRGREAAATTNPADP